MDTFETAVPRDFNGASLSEVEDEIRFRQARPGDHLCTPFQCPECQSLNIRGRGLTVGNTADDTFEFLCIRATLDAFWRHSTSTVRRHVAEVRFIIRYCELLEIASPFPPLGPYPRGFHGGMFHAIMVIRRSLELGRNGRVKFGTARNVRSTLTVLWECSPLGGGDATFSSNSKSGRFVITRNPSESRWFQYFIHGCRARMGDIVKQDRAYSFEVFRKLVDMYEAEFRGGQMSDESLCACMFLLVTCLGGMRGYEAVWTDLAMLSYDVEFCETAEDFEAVAWPIVGRFKARGHLSDCYHIPIAGTTDSGVHFFTWTQRFINRLARKGVYEGWAFRRPGPDGNRAIAADYRKNIFTKLELIQATTTLIDPMCDIWEEYGIQRSGRRCFVAHCTNQGIPAHVIELQARWQTDRTNGERAVQRSMIHLYSETRLMKKLLVKPSKVF